MVERHARVNALARAHFSSASEWGNVPRAMVLPAHCHVMMGVLNQPSSCVSVRLKFFIIFERRESDGRGARWGRGGHRHGV